MLTGSFAGTSARHGRSGRLRRRSANKASRTLIDSNLDEKPLLWPIPLCIGVGIACVGVPWLNLQTVAAMYQGVGIALTALGLAAIGDRVRRTMEATAAAYATTRSGVTAWITRRRQQLADLWARIVGKPRPTNVRVVTAEAQLGANATLKVDAHRRRVDRSTISDRDWLVYLDDRLASAYELLDAADKRRSEDRDEFARRLGAQRDELRAEIVRETRNGWQFVAWGLGYTFIGVVLGAFVT